MKRILLFLLVLNILITPALAEEEIMDINVPVTIDFKGERYFILTTELGDKVFSFNDREWNETILPSDYTWNMGLTRKFNWTEKCPDDVKIWKNLTMTLDENIKDCNKIWTLNNESHFIAREYADLKEGLGRQSTKLEDCKTDLVIKTEKANQFESCDTTKRNYLGQLNTCKEDKTSLEDKGQSNPILWLVLGGVGGFFLGKRKEAQPKAFQGLGDSGLHP